MNKFVIIIPNYNGEEFIEDTLLAIKESLPNVCTVVVDDASNDDSCVILKSLDCVLIEREENGGFATAVNTGLGWALSHGFEYALITNSDIIINDEVAKSILISLSENFEDPNTAIVGFQEAGCITPRAGEEISGFLFGVRLSIIQRVGLLDETFIMYGEERDFFRRVILGGAEIKQSGIFVQHKAEGSAASPRRNSWLAIRNSLYLEFKYKYWLRVLKTTLVLFLLINKIYLPRDYRSDPSYVRVTRVGLIRGNYFLFAALLWNANKFFNEIFNDAKSKFKVKS